MKQLLIQLVALILLSLCNGQDFCHQKQCPQYELIENHKDKRYEERLYEATQWITTKIESTATSHVIAANARLKDYCKTQNDAGYKITSNSWPVLVTNTESQDLFLSWFVPPGTALPEDKDPSVFLQSKPAGTVYVWVFGGTPSLDQGRANANRLWEALDKKCTNFPTYAGAGYDSLLSFTHHNEIWIRADDIHCENAK